MDGNTYTTEDLSYTFNDAGIYYVCLTETDASDCSDNNCQVVQILGTDPCVEGLEICNLVLNGNLAQLDIPIGGECHSSNDDDIDCEFLVCNWDDYPSNRTPFYCNNNGFDNNVTLASWDEGISTEAGLALVNGETYTLSFEYLHRTYTNPSASYSPLVEVGLLDSDQDPSSEVLLGQIDNPQYRYF